MPISLTSNTEVTYKEITDFILEKICNAAVNCDVLNNPVLENRSVQIRINQNKGDIPIYTDQNNKLYKVVEKTRIRNQFNSFLESRGLSSKSDEPVSLKGIINLFNNAANFITARLTVTGSHSAYQIRYRPDRKTQEDPYRAINDSLLGDPILNRQIFYDDNDGIGYITTNDIEESMGHDIDSYTKEQITTSLEDIIKNYLNNQKVYTIDAVISHTCCSSSSSSSSSCSSSSSSSSAFIGYMLL